MIGCGFVIGIVIFFFFIFVGKRMMIDLMDGVILGVVGRVFDVGWFNLELFCEYFEEYFLRYVIMKVDWKVFFLLDGYKFYIFVGFV